GFGIRQVVRHSLDRKNRSRDPFHPVPPARFALTLESTHKNQPGPNHQEISPMYLWEMIAHRLRNDGWTVWHNADQDASEPIYIVHLQRLGQSHRASGPTLTDAFAEASRQVRKGRANSRAEAGPHFTLPSIYAAH
ncbi:MAG: hypothetical protein ABI353_07600, partial [Isosphaeraceae bacterium]